jgi:hypothetical protein
LEIWKAFDINVWIFILTAFIFIIIADKLINKNKNISIYDTVWVYFKPIIGIGERFQINNLIYILWALSFVPLIEIFKNDLLANLIAAPDLNADNIVDLLEDRLTVYTDRYKYGTWRTSTGNVFMRLLGNNELLAKFDLLFNRTKELDFGSKYWHDLIDQPKKLRAVIKKSAIIEDVESVNIFKSFLEKFISVHLGEESYLPKLITPLCYGPQFKFVKEAEEVLVFTLKII